MVSVTRPAVAVAAPVLLAAFPALSLFAQNQTDVSVSVLAWPLVLSVGGALVTFLVGLLVTRRADRAGVLASLAALAILYFGVAFPSAGTGTAAAWVLGFALAAALLLKGMRDLWPVVLLLAVAAAVMTLPRAAAVVRFQAGHHPPAASDPRWWPSPLPPVPAATGTRPDVFVLIPDDYARADILRQYFQYDDTPFLHALTARGFAVDVRVRSPYSDSESNIASTLNLDYLSRFPAVLGPQSQDVRPVKSAIRDNRAARLLAAAGYDYVHLDTDEVTFPGSNPGIPVDAPPDSFANLWLSKSLLHVVGGPLGFDASTQHARYRASVRRVFGQLAAIRRHGRPLFVVFHTLLPHDPYVFRADGRPARFGDTTDRSLSGPAGRRAYLEQLAFLHGQLLTAVDAIRAQAPTPPVIVLQSDEGFQADPADFGEAAMADIRVKGLFALLLPGSTPALPEPPSTVNTLRLVFNRVLGTRYPLLPSVSYPERDLPYDYRPMTVR